MPPPPAPRRPVLGALLLVGAAFCWGFGFYAQRVSIMELTPLVSTAARFVLAMPVVLAALWWRRRQGVPMPWLAGTILGVLLYIAFAMQTVAMQHTPVSRVALLTGLYAVFTPLLQPLFRQGRPTPVQLGAAALAMVGTVLLCGVVGDATATSTPANVGDLLTLIMAVICAAMVLLVARFGPHTDAIALNGVQILAMTIVSVVVAVVVEDAPLAAVGAMGGVSLLSLLYLAVFSTIVAFTLQFIGQRHLSPGPASIVMLLEVPVGVVGAVLLLGEDMAGLQWFGAVVAVGAVVVAVVGERQIQPPVTDAARPS